MILPSFAGTYAAGNANKPVQKSTSQKVENKKFNRTIDPTLRKMISGNQSVKKVKVIIELKEDSVLETAAKEGKALQDLSATEVKNITEKILKLKKNL